MSLSACSALGRQTKALEDGYWYKLDSFGYESAAEAMCSNINRVTHVPAFVEYEECTKEYRGMQIDAVKSRDFTIPGYALQTIDDICGDALAGMSITTPRVTLRKFIEIIKRCVEADWVEDYIIDMLWQDVLTFNVDRHLNNIAIFTSPTGVKKVPFFDFGDSLFSDMRIFKNITPETAKSVIDKCKMFPFGFTVKEMCYALTLFKPYPYELSAVENGEWATSVNEEASKRARICVDYTSSIIKSCGGYVC